MGAWGVKIYQNDLAEDIKDQYMDYLREGKTNEEATRELISEYEEVLQDIDDGSNFWFVLADQQWKIGRLLPYVKEQALNWIEKGGDLHIWYESSEKLGNERKKVLEELSQRLNSPQPHEKKIYKRQYYTCPWKNGDVFAIPLDGYIKNDKFLNKYIMFQQSEQIKFNDNIIPIIRCWITDSPIFDVNKIQCIRWMRIAQREGKYNYAYLLYLKSKRSIPKNLIYIGNYDLYIPKDDGGNIKKNNSLVLHNTFVDTIIRNYKNYCD